MSGLLAQMQAHSAARALALRQRVTIAALRARIADRPAPPPLVLSGFDLIAEIKWRSPSAGALTDAPRDRPAATAARARRYAAAGAAAISVLTEPLRFGGDLSLLTAAAAVSPVPVMRKDFLVEPCQVLHSAALGAGGVLLIARMLSDARLAELLDAAQQARLFVLVEAFDAEDLARIAASALPPGALVGVNTRDLVTLGVDSGRLAALVGAIPAGAAAVAESGMACAADVGAAGALGYTVALVGSALMQAASPAALIASMRQAGRAGCSSRSAE